MVLCSQYTIFSTTRTNKNRSTEPLSARLCFKGMMALTFWIRAFLLSILLTVCAICRHTTYTCKRAIKIKGSRKRSYGKIKFRKWLFTPNSGRSATNALKIHGWELGPCSWSRSCVVQLLKCWVQGNKTSKTLCLSMTYRCKLTMKHILLKFSHCFSLMNSFLDKDVFHTHACSNIKTSGHSSLVKYIWMIEPFHGRMCQMLTLPTSTVQSVAAACIKFSMATKFDVAESEELVECPKHILMRCQYCFQNKLLQHDFEITDLPHDAVVRIMLNPLPGAGAQCMLTLPGDSFNKKFLYLWILFRLCWLKI